MKRTQDMVSKFILIFFLLCQTQMYHFQEKEREKERERYRERERNGENEMKCGPLFGSVSFYMALLFSG